MTRPRRARGPSVQSPLETYLREINETALLSAEEEKVLAQWDAFGQGFVKTDIFTEIIYASLTKQPSGPQNSHGHITK